MYEVGNHLVHPMYGAGIVKDIISNESDDGGAGTCYCVSFPSWKIEMTVPVCKCDCVGIRYVIDKSEIQKVLDVLSEESDEMNANWNKRYRENTDRMHSGDICEVAAVVRNLSRRHRLKPLSTGEKKLLIMAKQILESELACSGGYTIEEVDELVESCI